MLWPGCISLNQSSEHHKAKDAVTAQLQSMACFGGIAHGEGCPGIKMAKLKKKKKER